MHTINFRLISVLITIALANACIQNDGDNGSRTNNTNGGKLPKPIQIYEWKQVKSMASNFKPTADKINHVASSKNNKWLYATANDGAELFAADLGAQFSDISNDTKWAKIALASTGLDKSAGQAELTAAVQAKALVSTELGVLVERYAGAANDDNGVGYLAGTSWTAAWSHKGKLHLYHPSFSVNKRPISAGLITKAGVEYPVLFSELANSQTSIGSTSALGPVKMGIAIFANGKKDLMVLRPIFLS